MLSTIFKYYQDAILLESEVIPWGSPIVSFGNINTSIIATLGINPSNREFVDIKGKELKGSSRRFHTLDSLGLTNWNDATEEHFTMINQLCEEYFSRNPYDGWFKKLDYIISGTSMSYYLPSFEACHLDLIPFATGKKWSDLTIEQRTYLLELTSDILGEIIKDSPIKILVLNGQTVVDNLQRVANTVLEKKNMPEWTLKRKNSNGVLGYAYTGIITKIGDVEIDDLYVLGFNHNIQSSYGVSTGVQTSIRNWVSKKVNEIL